MRRHSRQSIAALRATRVCGGARHVAQNGCAVPNRNRATGDGAMRCVWALGVAISALLLAQPAALKAASDADKSVARLVWPPPPAEPRVAYVRSISGPGDLKVRVSFGRRLSNWLFGTKKGKEKLARPFGIAVDDEDNLLLTDTSEAAVCYFDWRKNTWQRWEKIGDIQLVSPVAVAKQRETFFVADSELAKVLAFRGKADLLFEITDGLQRPCGLAIAEDKLFVTDSKAHAVLVFDLKGRLLSQFGRRGTGPGEFNFPTHIAAGPEGRLLVTDSMNHRVQLLDTAGQPLGVVGRPGDSSGQFSRPKGVAFDGDGHIYATDALFDNIQVFSQQGEFLLSVGTTGSEPGEFWLPNGIAISRDQKIYVADSYNHRVQVFQYLEKP